LKKSNPILLWDDYYIEGYALFLAILGCFHTWVLGLLLIYLYWQRKAIKIPVFLIAICVLLIRFYLYEKIEIPETIEGNANIVDVKAYEYSDLITIKYHNMKFLVFVDSDQYMLGDEIYVKGTIDLYRKQTIPYGFNQSTYYLSQNIRGYIDVDDIHYISHHTSFYQFRDKLNIYISRFESNAYIRALILGEKSFSNEQNDMFKDLGILYLFTISGLHIYAFITLMKKVFFYLSLNENTETILIIIIYFIFLYLNAFSMSILRIFIIFLLSKLFKYLKIELSHLDLIHISFFLMLVTHIYWIYHFGFLIIFIILNFLYLMRFHYQKYTGYFKRMMISGIIMYVTLPFQLSIPILLVILLPGIIFTLSTPFFLLSIIILFIPELDVPFYQIIQFFEWILQNLEYKNIVINLPALPFTAMVIYYLLLVILFRSTNLISFVKRNIYIFLLFCFFVFDINILDEVHFYMIDVGQGDSMLIESPSCVILIDSFQNVLPFINHLGIYHIDYMILTHSDNDHIEEAQNIIDHIDVSYLVLNPYNNYPVQHDETIIARSDDHFKCGKLEINFLGPLKAYDDTNNNSLVFQIRLGKSNFLFTGDIEQEAEIDLVSQYGYLLKSDIIKIPHHGSITSSSDDFIRHVNPEIALISVGQSNRYGFPDSEVINRLMSTHVEIYRTDQMGTIEFRYYQKKEKWVVHLPF